MRNQLTLTLIVPKLIKKRKFGKIRKVFIVKFVYINKIITKNVKIFLLL